MHHTADFSYSNKRQKEPVIDFPRDFDNRLFIFSYQSVQGVRVDLFVLLCDFETVSIGDRFISQPLIAA